MTGNCQIMKLCQNNVNFLKNFTFFKIFFFYSNNFFSKIMKFSQNND